MTVLALSPPALNEWIAAHKAAGRWVTVCVACGWYFAQPRLGQHHGMRRARLCNKQRCACWFRWQRFHGRAPPANHMAVLTAKYGDSERVTARKAQPEEQAFEWCGT